MSLLTRTAAATAVAEPRASKQATRIRVGSRVTIYQTPASRFWYMNYNTNNRQVRQSLKTTKKKQAIDLATKKDAQLVLGQDNAPRQRTTSIREAAEKYLASQKTHLGEQSQPRYARELMQFVTFSDQVGVRLLEHATAEHFEAFQARLGMIGSPAHRKYMKKDKTPKRVRGGPNGPGTTRGKMKMVRQFLKWSTRRQLVRYDPSPGYRLPPPSKLKPQPFTAAELRKILDAAVAPFKDVFDFFRLTGLLNEELCWLMKEDVDAQLRFVHVRRKTCPFTGTLWTPKHSNERIIPLAPQALEIAKRRLKESHGPWLFHAPNTIGPRPGQFTKQRILKNLKVILKAQGIGHGTVHTFRHCFCSFLANAGVSPFLVMKFMGHASLDIVMTYYHAGHDDLLAGMAAVDLGKMLGESAQRTPQTSKEPAKPPDVQPAAGDRNL